MSGQSLDATADLTGKVIGEIATVGEHFSIGLTCSTLPTIHDLR
jgi:hypothetical protein